MKNYVKQWKTYGRVPKWWGQYGEGTQFLNVFPWLFDRMVSRILSFVTDSETKKKNTPNN